MVGCIKTYGTKHFVINKKCKEKTTASEMGYWRRSCRLSKLDRFTKDMLSYTDEKKLLLYGHVRRAGDGTWIMRITDLSDFGKKK